MSAVELSGVLDLKSNTLHLYSDQRMRTSLAGTVKGDSESVLRKSGQADLTINVPNASDFNGAFVVEGGFVSITQPFLPDNNKLTISPRDGNTTAVKVTTPDRVGAIAGDGGGLDLDGRQTTLQIGGTTANLGVNTFAGAIIGLGKIQFIGTHNTTNLTGKVFVQGGIEVNAGTVLMNGTGFSATEKQRFSVGNGATLGGSGTMGVVTVASGGRLAPGNSVGTMTVDSLALAAGSEMVVELDGESADKVVASGAITLNGGALRVAKTGGATVAPGITWTLLQGQSLTGTFGNVTTDYAFYTPAALYDGTSVKLQMTRNAVAPQDLAVTDNQKKSSTWFNGLPSGSDVSAALLGLSAEQARAAYDNLSGEVHADVQGRAVQNANQMVASAMEYMRKMFRLALSNANFNQSRRGPATGGDNGLNLSTRGDEMDKPLFWGSVSGTTSQQSRTDGFAAASASSFGLTGGLDFATQGAWRLGTIVGANRITTGMSDRSSDSSTTAMSLGLFAAREFGNLGLGFGLLQDYSRTDATRRVSVGGLNQTLTSSYDTRSTVAFVEGSARIAMSFGELTPFLRLSQVRTVAGAFSENGGSAALSRAERTTDVTLAKLGLRGAADLQIAGKAARLTGGVSYQSVVSGGYGASLHAFSAGGSAAEIRAGVGEGQAMGLDLGLNVKLTEATDLDFTYNGARAAGVDNHTLGATLSIRF